MAGTRTLLLALGVAFLVWSWVAVSSAQEPIKIGVLLPYTGVIAIQAQDNTRGFELHLKQVGGQAGGRPITLIKEDDQVTPDSGLTELRKLVARDHVGVIFGPVHCGTTRWRTAWRRAGTARPVTPALS